MALTQENRLLSVSTPLGADVLLLNHLSGTEAVSSLFKFDLELLAEPENAGKVDPKKLLGRAVTVSVTLLDNSARYFNGVVSRFSEHGSDERFVSYRAEVVPWFWLLTLGTDCRIFQDKSVPEIIEAVFAELGFADFRITFSASSYTKLDYCVQYRETHFNFLSRLMEKEGIFYFFEHEDGKHTMVIADANVDCVVCPNQSRVRYAPTGGAGEREDAITDLVMEEGLRPGRFTMRDFHFQMPSKPLEVSEETTIKVGDNTKLEIFDYPGKYALRFNQPEKRLDKVEEEGRRMARIHMQEEEAAYREISGRSHCRDFSSGYRYNLTHHADAAVNGEYVLTSVHHTVAQSPEYYSGAGARSGTYQNSFRCIPQKVPFRPQRVTPKPLVQGVQAAEVVGKAGEEIWTDKFGRVKVQFPWDRQGKRDENSSCWIRVSQPTAGKGWGAVSIPRIGQEVIVDFVEGDPDQPIITGRVYNADLMPPYDLPNSGMVSGGKSKTVKGVGYNEMSMDDTKGKEKMTVHAQYDMNSTVENDQTLTVHNNRTSTIDVDDTESVGANQKISIGADQTIEVKGNREASVDGNDTEGVKGNQDVSVSGTQSLASEGKQTISSAAETEIGAPKINVIGDNVVEISVGGSNIKVEPSQITIASGASSVKLDPSGVTVTGPMIKLN